MSLTVATKIENMHSLGDPVKFAHYLIEMYDRDQALLQAEWALKEMKKPETIEFWEKTLTFLRMPAAEFEALLREKDDQK